MALMMSTERMNELRKKAAEYLHKLYMEGKESPVFIDKGLYRILCKFTSEDMGNAMFEQTMFFDVKNRWFHSENGMHKVHLMFLSTDKKKLFGQSDFHGRGVEIVEASLLGGPHAPYNIALRLHQEGGLTRWPPK